MMLEEMEGEGANTVPTRGKKEDTEREERNGQPEEAEWV